MREQMKSLDELEMGDLWAEAQGRTPRPQPEPPTPRSPIRSRVAAGIVAFAVFIAAGIFAWQAFHPAPATERAPGNGVAGMALWPDRTAAELAKTQALADSNDPSVSWRLDPKEVATRFSEEVLGWGRPGAGNYTVSIDPSWGPTPMFTASVAHVAIPCPTPPPGEVGTCPPPFDGETLTLRQLGTTGEAGIWSVTSVMASGLSMKIAPGQQVANGAQIGGVVSYPSTWKAVSGFHSQVGYHVGTDGGCDVTQANDAEQGAGALMSITADQNLCADTAPAGYAWTETGTNVVMPVGGVKDPLSVGGDLISPRFFGLTLVPFTLTFDDATTQGALPNDPCRVVTATQVAEATGGQVTSTRRLTPSDMKSVAPGMPLPCDFDTDSRFGAVVVTVDPTHLAGFTTEQDRNATNTMSIPGLGDEAFISGGASIWVRVGDGYFSIGSQRGAGIRASAMLEVLAKDALHNVGYAASPSGPSPPPTVSPTPSAAVVDYTPSSVGFWDREHGVIVGTASCRRCGALPGGFIATTGDGGQTWRLTNQSYPPLGTVSVVPGGVAYADAGSRIVRTTDYGVTWNRVNPADAVSPSFSSKNDGWAAWVGNQGAGGEGQLLHTSDGGRIYTKVASPCPSSGPQIQGLSFPTPTEGWVLCTGQPGAGNQWKAVYRTSDGGASWTKVYGSGFTYGYPQQVSFLPDGHGWLLFSIRGQPEYTTDGGAHWTASDVAQPEVSQLVTVSFLNDQEGYAVRWQDGRAELLHTTDGGQSWTFVSDVKPNT